MDLRIEIIEKLGAREIAEFVSTQFQHDEVASICSIWTAFTLTIIAIYINITKIKVE